MKPILVIYATREGHTRHIAGHVGNALGARNQPNETWNSSHFPDDLPISKFGAAIVSASLHMGKFEREIARFVISHRDGLANIPTVFLPVSLAERTVEDPATTPEKRTKAQAHIKHAVDAFLSETGWQPTQIVPVAGALTYSRYNFFTRFIMKSISKNSGGPVDTSRDYEFTDWQKLDQVIEEFVQSRTLATV
jgi:menaquinone-dependent protoporphyrinogen oxidase